jgi:hypothetical protein
MSGVAYVDAPKVPKDEAAFVAINKLDPKLQPYAWAWWHYMESPGGPQPDPEAFGLTYGQGHQQAQSVRVALAAIV